MRRDSFLQLRPFFDRLFRGCIAIEARRRWVPGSDLFQLVVILENDLLSLLSLIMKEIVLSLPGNLV